MPTLPGCVQVVACSYILLSIMKALYKCFICINSANPDNNSMG